MLLGGGPAGATAALNLAPFRNVLVVERETVAGPRIGESLVAAAKRLLADMGLLEEFLAQNHLSCLANHSVWGTNNVSRRTSIVDPDGEGWHLDRATFELWLRDVAKRRGAVFVSSVRLESIVPEGSGWRLTLCRGGILQSVRCEFVIDASGRAASIGKRVGAKRELLDRLSAAWIYGTDRTAGIGGITFVEAVQDGWWYTAPLPGARRVVAFQTDSDLPSARKLRSPASLLAAVKDAEHLVGLLSDVCFEADGVHGVRIASSSRLTPPSGPRWIAAGDAAMTFDPLSSQGLFNGLYTGLAAAETAHRCLSGEISDTAEYRQSLNDIWSAYRTHLKAWYGLERRWPRNEFWLRRFD